MRIQRIKLQDFRGVDSAEVEFDTDGVTIVEGANETGKTSLADAFDLLLTQKDSAAKRPIKAAKPIGRDVGPLVEAELTVGPYRLVYRKRWLRDKKTELEIFEPAREQLSGEAAHNRMSGILAEETDQVLFAALRYQQGSEISQAALAEAPSLAAALDAAAGGGEHDPAEAGRSDALLGLVDQERRRYFTAGGKALAVRTEKGKQLKALEGEVAATQASIAELDQAADRLTQIEREMVELGDRLPDLEERIAAGARDLKAVEAVEQKVEAARQTLHLAEAALGEAETKLEARITLIDAAERAASALAEVVKHIAADESDLDVAKGRAVEAQRVHTAASEAVDMAEKVAKADREWFGLLDLHFRRDDLKERRRRLEAADEEIVDAERFLAGSIIDEALVASLDAAQIQVAVAVARAEAGQARLVVEALKPLDLQLDSGQRRVEPGEPVEAVVATETVAVIDDVARLIVMPAQKSSEVEDEVARARAHFRDLLEAAGVSSVAAANDLLRERSRRESARDNASQRRAEALRDLEPAELVAKLERAELRLDKHEQGDASVDLTPAAFEEAQERVHLTEERLEGARAEADEAKLGLREVEGTLRVLEDKYIERRTRRETAEGESKRTQAELDAARATVGDKELEETVGGAKIRVADAAVTCEEVEAEFRAGDPETVRVTVENDQQLKDRLIADLGARRVAAAEAREQLRLGGVEGLWDQLAETRAKLTGLGREVASEDRLAAAAEYLHDLLTEKREQAQRVYVGPFTEKVNFYARILFGSDVAVEVDHRDFSLVARTLDGTTVPFDSLSGGAREQLVVLARLACAALVSPGGAAEAQRGVPVIIDDALGYSDPLRLEKLGAAFGVAGRDCQVIVLTCEPGRYRSIGGAKVVSLERNRTTPGAMVGVSVS
jgi:hypothetical protein